MCWIGLSSPSRSWFGEFGELGHQAEQLILSDMRIEPLVAALECLQKAGDLYAFKIRMSKAALAAALKDQNERLPCAWFARVA
ncbi:hypothetical protein CQ13_28320 [Bradyrhizobium retamae]|uniref:Uncharacterized protein n=1 Tax=Bradyrhizobium retamae TaxID=1300035 RepID=A0A0R3MRK2_9BRAD|nr:hypothetical protein CQ13_28320 [Bradyrhizobium retamae]